MLRQSIIKAARPAFQARAAFTTTTRVMAGGDTGAPRPQGGQGDAFNKREKAQEDFAIREREKEKLSELKKKLKEQNEHLGHLEKSIAELTKKTEQK